MLSLQQLTEKMSKLDDWSIEGNSILKQFEFKDFKESMIFVNNLAEISEKINHHPEIFINYNFVRVTLTTHSVEELTDKDFSLAEEIDKIAAETF